jgi:hypothetical protein
VRPPPEAPTRRLFVHIGAPKTGTKYLQGLLWENREQLERHGVHLPGKRQRFHFAAGSDLIGDRGETYEDQVRTESQSGGWDRFRSALARSDAATAVFTDERLAALTPEAIERVTEADPGREIHVVYAVRDLAAALPSTWQTAVRHGATETLEDWVSSMVRFRPDDGPAPWFWQVSDAAAVLDRWSAAVAAPTHFHVITVPRPDQEPEELWRRFASVVGLPSERPVNPPRRVNRSLSYAQVEFLRRMNSALGEAIEPAQYRRLVRGVLATQVMSHQAAGPRPVLPEQFLPKVTDHATRIAAALSSSGVDIVGDLADVKPRPHDASPAPTDAEVLNAAVGAIAGLVERMSKR